MATTRPELLGIATPVPMGDWQSSVKYQKLNIVRYNGASYIAKKQNQNFEPTVTQGWQEVWQALVYDGNILSDVVVNGTYPEMTVGKAEGDGDGNNIADTYLTLIKWLDEEYPVGGNRPYIQFPNCPTPASIYPNTSWEIDTTMQGRTIIGSGGEYAFGATGGSDAHNHGAGNLYTKIAASTSVGQLHGDPVTGIPAWTSNWNRAVSLSALSDGGLYDEGFGVDGATADASNIPPYAVVNYWKRTA